MRPSGLVTSSWNKHTVNPAADPQVKVMTQWIAAAVVSTPSNRSSVSIVRDPVPVKDQTIVGSDGSSTPIEKSASVSEIDSTHFIEYRISPLILCTNNDPRLKEVSENMVFINCFRVSESRITRDHLSTMVRYLFVRKTRGADR